MSVQKEVLLCLDLLLCLMPLKELVVEQDSSGLIRTAVQFVILNACSYLNSSGVDVGTSKYHFEFSADTNPFFLTSRYFIALLCQLLNA